MTVKISGRMFKKFYNNETIWKDGAYHDDEVVVVDGKQWSYDKNLEDVPDDAIIEITGGVFYKYSDDTEGADFERVIRKWIRQQNTTVMIIDVPNEKFDSVIQLLKDNGIMTSKRGG